VSPHCAYLFDRLERDSKLPRRGVALWCRRLVNGDIYVPSIKTFDMPGQNTESRSQLQCWKVLGLGENIEFRKFGPDFYNYDVLHTDEWEDFYRRITFCIHSTSG
jgi:hypothetical protein